MVIGIDQPEKAGFEVSSRSFPLGRPWCLEVVEIDEGGERHSQQKNNTRASRFFMVVLKHKPASATEARP